MLKVEIIVVGKVKSDWLKTGIDHYRKLVSKYADVKVTSVKEGDNAHLPEDRIVAFESEKIAAKLTPRAMKIVLDEDGRRFSSREFARFLERVKLEHSELQFVVGGAYGVEQRLKASLDLSLSLSQMTFPHELALVLLLEQLYRASSISSGSKYHK